MTYDDCDYYYYGLTIYIICITEYPWDCSTSWIFTVIKLFISLYVVLLRRPTVACLLFIYFISPLCGVAETPDYAMLVIYLLYKPFLWCR